MMKMDITEISERTRIEDNEDREWWGVFFEAAKVLNGLYNMEKKIYYKIL